MDKPEQYVYSAVVQEVIDADTFRLTVDLGFHTKKHLIENPVRLAGVDAPELGTEAGDAALSYVRGALNGREVRIKTLKTGHYGRWLIRLWADTLTTELTTALLNRGYYKVDDDHAVDPKFMPDGFVDINEASVIELQWLPGVGPKTAELIIDRRPYSKTIELMDVDGIGSITYDQLSRLVSAS